jgi:carboxymethylenebutenolidase
MVEDAVRDLGKKVDRIGIIGWSFGNWYAWKAAKAHRDRVGALVLFYGIALDDAAAPVPPVLSHYAELDEFENLDDTRQVEREMKAAGNDVRVELYRGTKHWFDEPSRPEYDTAASALAWDRNRAFLNKHLG